MPDTPETEVLREALQEQYRAGLAMLADCVRKCTEDLWQSGPHPRTFWRIAFHAVYFTHLYLGQNEAAYQPWPGRPEGCPDLWRSPWTLEPFELPEDFAPYTREEILDYIDFVDALLAHTIDTLDLYAAETGLSWYKNMGKLSHEMMNLRHIQGHVGQLSERLMACGIDTDWISRVKPSMSLSGGRPALPG